MSTYREVVYLVSDEMKNVSDDSIVNIDHIAFVVDKHRASVLKQLYSSIKKDSPQSNYQTICVKMQPEEGDICECPYLKSVHKIPFAMQTGPVTIGNNGVTNNRITFVDRNRFAYAGTGRYSANMAYASYSNGYLLLKSKNEDFLNIEEVQLTGMFEDGLAAAKLACDKSDAEKCDPLDSRFPLEDNLIPMVVEMSLRELLGMMYRPADQQNNANDDIADIHRFVSQNMKRQYMNNVNGN